MSRFRQYSIGSLFNSAKNIFQDTIDKVKDTYNDVINKADNLIKSTFGGESNSNNSTNSNNNTNTNNNTNLSPTTTNSTNSTNTTDTTSNSTVNKTS